MCNHIIRNSHSFRPIAGIRMGMLFQATDRLAFNVLTAFCERSVFCIRSVSFRNISIRHPVFPGDRLLYVALIPMDMVRRVIFLFPTYYFAFFFIAVFCMGMPCHFFLPASQFPRLRVAPIPMGMPRRFLLAAHQFILAAVAGITVDMASGTFLLPTDNIAIFVIAPIPMTVPRRLFLAASQICLRLVTGRIVGMACQFLLAAGQFPGC